MNKITETGHGTGAIHSPLKRIFRRNYKTIGNDTAPMNWQTGFDVEAELGQVLNNPNFKLPVLNQGKSFSCGAQVASEISEILEAYSTKVFNQRSAHDAYAHIFYPDGGGTSSDRIKNLLIKRGVALEKDVPSYDAYGNPLNETDYRSLAYDNAVIEAEANLTKDTTVVNHNPKDIDDVARGVRDLGNVCLLIYGKDNGTWDSAFPNPPIAGSTYDDTWHHYILGGKAKLSVSGDKKYIWILNSWGTRVGYNGWQAISEDYFKSGYVKDAFSVADNGDLNMDKKTAFNYFTDILNNAIIYLKGIFIK